MRGLVGLDTSPAGVRTTHSSVTGTLSHWHSALQLLPPLRQALCPWAVTYGVFIVSGGSGQMSRLTQVVAQFGTIPWRGQVEDAE